MKNDLKYKESNVSWLGKIPMDWSLVRGKYLFSRKKEINKDLKCKNLLSLTYDGVLNKDFYANEGLRPENYNTYQLFDKDDLVFKMIDLSNIKTSRVGIVHEYGIMSSAYIRFQPLKKKIYPKFAYWFFYDLYKKEIYNYIGSGVRSTLSSDDMSEFELPLPQIEEQKLIYHFLDKKTEEIDKLIHKIYKKIELLKEQRLSQLNLYVTKGINSNVELKNSSVDWLEEIPKHWTQTKIRFLTEDHRQGFYTSDPYDDEGIPILRITDIKEDHFFSYLDSPKYSRPENEIKNFYVKEGDFLFPRTGGVGRFGIVNFNFPCIYGSFLIRFRFNKLINKQFMQFFLESSIFIDQVKKEIHGGVNQNVHVDNIKNVILFLPPIDEQTHISENLLKNTQKIDETIKLEKKRIKLLNEYRQSLISSAVTGKVRITENMI